MKKDRSADLELLFNPNSIALIGASNDPGKWGHRILDSIVGGGYRGNVYPVNPRTNTVLGMAAYPGIGSVPGTVDVALVCTPARDTLEVVRECAAAGARFAIVIPAGYGEVGESGLEAERFLVEAAGNCRLMGPNTMGIMSTPSSLYAYMSLARPRPGGVALVSQSGNIGTQILGRGEKDGIGFSYFASSGNEADLSMEHYLSYFAGDERTSVVLAYIEGFKDARGFLDSARKVTRRKPLVAYKAGRTSAGARAARSHCGAMATSDDISDGGFSQVGIVRARTTEEILDLAKAFSSLPLPRGPRVGIISWGGGWGVVGADMCQETGFEVAPLDDGTLEALDRLLPSYWSGGNPIDLVGSLDLDCHLQCMEMLMASDSIDSVVALGTISGFPDFQEHDERFLERSIELTGQYGKPVMLVKMFEGYHSEFIHSRGSLVFSSPERAISALWRMYEYYLFRQALPP
ncbi:MAG: CoA-binding protein [Actinobacteria bacterium]|nr:CoA-binding protein [Actinomycetota bacterium]MCG2818424.1 CoA-binding protein [Actinomycetes bacterium]MBU4219950.1 CoA-binding protein [Actinomycetota bacterium]MBU4358296.1 CoA-binding protein [Actinomycetota bacterium]MBU4392823.1 CoA-binding protein [Actinomycetota bacterium]